MTTKNNTKSTKTEQTDAVSNFGFAMPEAFQKLFDENMKGYETFFAAAKGSPVADFPGMDDAKAQGQAYMDAYMSASAVYVKGVEEITAQWTNYGKQFASDSAKNLQDLMATRTPNEALELHGTHSKALAEEFVAHGNKIVEMTTKTAKDAAGPITDRINESMTAFNKFAA